MWEMIFIWFWNVGNLFSFGNSMLSLFFVDGDVGKLVWEWEGFYLSLRYNFIK